ncbi:MAG TPA: SRPBCC domain-containing protein [Acidimicrobiales bacterium]|nr:SRPBCC domain-containing protein [Acidimicrobiales bacterium]
MTENPESAIVGTLHADGGEGLVRMSALFQTGIENLWSALTESQRLARWYGNFEGEFHVGGLFTAFIPSSGWEGHGRINECKAPVHLSVTMWEKMGDEQGLKVDLVATDSQTNLVLEKRGISPELCWAFGAGWQAHLEDLSAYLVGLDKADLSASWNNRFDELEPLYRAMSVTPL